MRQTFQYKLYRHKRNRKLHQQINVGGMIYNHCIALHRRYYHRYGTYLSPHQLKLHITKLKRLAKYQYWFTLGSQAIQDIVERIDQGYQKFFRKENTRPPGFRKVRKAKSFTLKHAGWTLLGGNRLRIGKHVYTFAKSRAIAGEIKTVTIKRDPLGHLFVYFSCIVEDESIDRAMTGHSAGFDFGLRTFLTGSDETRQKSPQVLKHSLNRVKQASRGLCRKLKGSRNRHKAKQHLVRVHKRVRNLRQAEHWRLAHELCATYDMIYLETLNLRGMKKLWGRKVSDMGFASFVSILHHVARKTGVIVHHIDQWFPSTKLCHVCHQVNAFITLRDRVWTCACGVTHDRDLNAAINIWREGASSHGGGHVRLTSVSSGC